MKIILIADDSPFVRLRLKNILSQLKPAPEIAEADSGKTALSQFEKFRPDLVLLDIVMPTGQEEGVDVLKKIMKFDVKAKVVMITAVGFDAMIEECRNLGAAGYVVKPFDEEDILDEVKKYL